MPPIRMAYARFSGSVNIRPLLVGMERKMKAAKQGTREMKGAMMKTAKITFKNGMEIMAEENGSCLVTDSRPEFPACLSPVIVSGAGGDHKYENAEVIECASTDGRYWFAFREMPEPERVARQMQANIEYIAMMTEVDLGEV